MVPVQLSYEEFWSRYYFRVHQEEERVRREEERKKQHELELAAAKEKAQQVDDDILLEGDELSETAVEEGSEEDEATLQQLREARANRKAAMQWKQKALEYQNQLAVLADQHAAAQEELKQRMEGQYQSLCDNYETKMMEVTTQIDEARAAGYDAGIQESEMIVASVRQDAEDQVKRLTVEVEELQKIAGGDTAALVREKAELQVQLERKEIELQSALAQKQTDADSAAEKNRELASLRERCATLEGQVASLEGVKATLEQQLQGIDQGSAIEELKKEMEVWKARAVKMKKMKEQIETELATLKSSTTTEGAGVKDDAGQVPELLEKIAALETEKAALVVQVNDANDVGAKEAEEKAKAQINELQSQLAAQEAKVKEVETAAFNRGAEDARHKMEAELQLLRSELAVLRASTGAGVPPVVAGGDVLAQADAVLSSLSSPTAALGSTTDGEIRPNATEGRDDWGEW
ncbi:hypothetical protein PINS_up002843 [Pythium insidiosum]|nr:hypothetical protein PINS_up002843 [Pythium insidiosum]